MPRRRPSPHRRGNGGADRCDGGGADDLRHVQGAVPRHRNRRHPSARENGREARLQARRPLTRSDMDQPIADSPARRADTAAAPLYGLVLAGGRSSRMQRDKAALEYAGRTQLERAIELITPLVERVFVSIRPDQAGDPLRARFAQIIDSGEVSGPMAGILAAQSRHPDAAWLVLACDLPLLDRQTLGHLLRSRRPERQATAYRSSHDGLPEPLCAIYEPASAAAIRAYVAGGRDCPRKFLINADTALIDQPDPGALDNVNTPSEYGSATDRLLSADRSTRAITGAQAGRGAARQKIGRASC